MPARPTGAVGPAVIVRDLAEGRVALEAARRHGVALTAVSAPEAGRFAGALWWRGLRDALAAAGRALGAKPDELEVRIGRLQAELKAAQREAAHLRDKLAAAQAGSAREVETIGGLAVARMGLEGLDAAALRNAADTLMQRSQADVVVVGSGTLLVVKASEGARARGVQAGRVVKALAERGGGGGGAGVSRRAGHGADRPADGDAPGALPGRRLFRQRRGAGAARRGHAAGAAPARGHRPAPALVQPAPGLRPPPRNRPLQRARHLR